MKKRILASLLAAVMILGLFSVKAKADDPVPDPNNPATVYLSISNDAQYVNTVAAANEQYDPSDPKAATVMAMKQITVPYFDLSEYGLSSYYYAGTNYGPDPSWTGPPKPPKSNLTPGTADYADGFVTMLHVMIYALEVYYYGVPEQQAGTGWLYTHNKFGTSGITIEGTVGSIYFRDYWGMNYNFNYYRNYDYPIASSGWGATADQVRVLTNDIITIGHFSEDYFMSDDYGIFAYAQRATVDFTTQNPVEPVISPDNDGYVNLTFGHAGLNMWSFTNTLHTAFNVSVPVYRQEIGAINSGNVASWIPVSSTLANGSITIDTDNWASGTYLVATPGHLGYQNSDSVCCTPGGILVVIP